MWHAVQQEVDSKREDQRTRKRSFSELGTESGFDVVSRSRTESSTQR